MIVDANVSLKQQKKSTFLSIRESLKREKFYFGRLAKYKSFPLAKVSSPKLVHIGKESNQLSVHYLFSVETKFVLS